MGVCFSLPREEKRFRLSKPSSLRVEGDPASHHGDVEKPVAETKGVVVEEKANGGKGSGEEEKGCYEKTLLLGDEKHVIMLTPKEKDSKRETAPFSNEIVHPRGGDKIDSEGKKEEAGVHAAQGESVVELDVEVVDVTRLMEGLDDDDDDDVDNVGEKSSRNNASSSAIDNALFPAVRETAVSTNSAPTDGTPGLHASAIGEPVNSGFLEEKKTDRSAADLNLDIPPPQNHPSTPNGVAPSPSSKDVHPGENPGFSFSSPMLNNVVSGPGIARTREPTGNDSGEEMPGSNRMAASGTGGDGVGEGRIKSSPPLVSQTPSVLTSKKAAVVARQADEERTPRSAKPNLPLPLSPVRFSDPFAEAGDQDVFDPDLLATYEETFKRYSVDEWMKNHSVNPRRVSLEYWSAAERKLSKRLSI